MYLISPEDISDVLSQPFVVAYWPMIVGTVIWLGFMMRGYTKAAILFVGLTLVYQAWHMGIIGGD